MPTIPPTHVGTQYGVCLIFLELYGRQVRWIDPVDWYAWSGNVWEPDATDEVRSMVRKCGEWITEHVHELAGQLPDADANGEGVAEHRKRLETDIKIWSRWGKECSDSYYQQQVMKQLRGLVGIKTPVSMTLSHPLYVNTRSGIIDLEEPGAIHRHRSIRGGSPCWPGEHNETSLFNLCQILPFQLPVTPGFDCDSLFDLAMHPSSFWADQCPLFYAFIHQTTCGQEDLVDSLRQALGYSMTGLTHERTLFVCYGSGANGKSVLLGLFRRLMGGYADTAPASILARKTADREAAIYLAGMVGKRLIVTSEYESGDFLPESLVKTITGGEDEIVARTLYSKPFAYKPTFKLWMMTNHKPSISNTSPSIQARIKLIPFNNIVPLARQDGNLAQRMWPEAPWIALWAITGWIRAQHFHGGRIQWAEIVRTATENYMEEQDSFGDFLVDHIRIEMGYTEPFRDVYKQYQKWAEENGHRTLSAKSFSVRMSERCPTIKRVRTSNLYLLQHMKLFRDTDTNYRRRFDSTYDLDGDIPEDLF